MLEALAAAVATALLSLGSGAALTAARKAGETRDTVLVLSTRMNSIESLLQRHLIDTQSLTQKVELIDAHLGRIDSRVTALENGVVDRRGRHDID